MKKTISSFISLCLFTASLSSFGMTTTTSAPSPKEIFNQWIGTLEMSGNPKTFEDLKNLENSLDEKTTEGVFQYISETYKDIDLPALQKNVENSAQENGLERDVPLTKDQQILLKNIVKEETENQGANYAVWAIVVLFILLPLLGVRVLWVWLFTDSNSSSRDYRDDSYRDREDDEDEEESGVEV